MAKINKRKIYNWFINYKKMPYINKGILIWLMNYLTILMDFHFRVYNTWEIFVLKLLNFKKLIIEIKLTRWEKKIINLINKYN